MIAKKLTALLLGMLTWFSASACTTKTGQKPENSVPVTGDVTITALNVGKADALVVQTQNTVTVIDTGEKGDGKKIEKFLEKQGIEAIDTLIITHFDKDHVGGAARLVKRMKIHTIYVPDYASESDAYTKFIEKVQENGNALTVLPAKGKLEWLADDAAMTLYAAEENSYGQNEENDFSLALYMQHGENTFLFSGDAENKRMQEIIGLQLGNVDFLKYPYHGNYQALSEQFLDACQPKVSIICCSEKEYADPETVAMLEKRGVDTYYTCNGVVTVLSDGKTLHCSQSAESPIR